MAALDFETLSREIVELCAMRDRLVAALTESITRLRLLGTCPPSEVLDAADRYRRQYLEIRQRLDDERCAALARPTASLDEWEQALRLTQRQQQVTDLLDDATAWRIRGADDLGPLSKVRDDVENLRGRLGDHEDEAVEDLLEGRHRLAAVRTLVHFGEELTDDVWAELLDRVSQDYGRELATAISRGKVLVSAANPLSDAAASVAVDRNCEVIS